MTFPPFPSDSGECRNGRELGLGYSICRAVGALGRKMVGQEAISLLLIAGTRSERDGEIHARIAPSIQTNERGRVGNLLISSK